MGSQGLPAGGVEDEFLQLLGSGNQEARWSGAQAPGQVPVSCVSVSLSPYSPLLLPASSLIPAPLELMPGKETALLASIEQVLERTLCLGNTGTLTQIRVDLGLCPWALWGKGQAAAVTEGPSEPQGW